MAFDPDAYLAQKEAPAAPAFDPDAYLKEKAAATVPGTGFDPDKYIQDKVHTLADQNDFDPAVHAAQTGDVDTAYAIQKARDARTMGQKAGALAETAAGMVAHPVKTLTPVFNFLAGFPQVALNTAQQFPTAAAIGTMGLSTLLPKKDPLTLQAEATLAAQHGEESVKNLVDVTAGALARNAEKAFVDPDPTRTAYRENYLKRNPAHLTPEQLEERKKQWAAEDAADKSSFDESLDRKRFEQKVQKAKNEIQLAQGIPLDTGAVSKIYTAGGQVPSEEVGPQALTDAGAPPVSQGVVDRLSAATDPNNVILSLAPGVPGASKVGGALTEAAGKVASIPADAALAAARYLPKARHFTAGAKGVIGAGAVYEAYQHPEEAAAIGGGILGLKLLGKLGRTISMQGRELRTGVPSSLTERAAIAAATGESALRANIGRKIGDTVAHGAQTAAGMAPLNAVLSEGDPKAFADLEGGAVAFGGTLQAFRRNRPALVEGIRPYLQSEGHRALWEAADEGDALAKKSAAYLYSIPEEARDRTLETIGALQGLPVNGKNGPTRARVYVLSEPDYLQAQKDVIPGQKAAMGGGRGFFYGPEGAAYINGDYHAGLDPSELVHTVGHEFGGHAAINVMRAAGAQGGQLYDGLIGSAKEALMPGGKATPAFKRFIAGYNKAFDPTGKTQRVNESDPHAVEEFIAETAGQIMAHRGAGELAVPKNIQDKISDGIGRFMGQMLGFDSRTVGTPTKFNREEVGALTQTVQDTLSQIVGMKLRGGAELPEAAKTDTTRIAELQDILSTPRPPTGSPVADIYAWRKAQRDARSELDEIDTDPVSVSPVTPATPPVAPASPVLPRAANVAPSPNAKPRSQAPSPTQPSTPSAPPVSQVDPSSSTATATIQRPQAAAVVARPEVATGPERAPVPSEPEVQALTKAAEEKATAAEKNPRTQAAKDRIRAAKVEAILDAIGDDPTGLHRQKDDLGNTEIVGDFDPENPLHRALTEASGMTAEQAGRIGQLQEQKGAATYVRYRSAISSAEGTGGEGTLDTGMANRRAEYDVDPAQQREAGTIQRKVVIPIETSATKGGGLVMKAFVPDNVLHNAESIFEGLKEMGRPNPYGATPGEQGPLLISDANAYAENHAHGYRGDGSGPIRQFPDSNLPHPDPNYTPQVIPKERFDVLNMAMHNETSGKNAERLAEVTEKRQKVAEAKTDKERARLQGVLERSIARQRQSEEASSLGEFNERWVDHQSGETNQLRSELKAAGFDTGERFKSPFENLLPKHILDVSPAPIGLQEDDIPSVRPTGLDVDPRALVNSGRPNDKAIAAGFLPSERIPGLDDTVLYRSADSPEAKSGAHFSTDKSDAEAYRDNPGFGGKNLYRYSVDASKTARVDTLRDLARELEPLLDESQREWADEQGGLLPAMKGMGYDHVFHALENSFGPRGGKIDPVELLSKDHDWIRFTDDFPAGATTLRYIGKDTLRPEK